MHNVIPFNPWIFAYLGFFAVLFIILILSAYEFGFVKKTHLESLKKSFFAVVAFLLVCATISIVFKYFFDLFQGGY